MVFSSHLFVFYFLPLALLLYYAAPVRTRHLLLTGLSYLFYGWANPLFVVLMAFSTAVDYACGRVIAAEGVCPGRISTEPRGANGFGYDPIFYFSALQRTMAELPPEVKNRISHRAAAIRRIATRLVAGFPDLKAD